MSLGVLLAIMSCGAVICGLIASGKGRSGAGWAVFGACFPVIALIAIACLPAKSEDLLL